MNKGRTSGLVRSFGLAALLGLSAWSADASAAVPQNLVQQGRLLDTVGSPAIGTVTITFRIYDDASGSNILWQETQVIALDDGYFSATLGNVTALGADVFEDGEVRWLGMQVGADSEMTPRQEIQSVPYALFAGDVRGQIHPSSVSVGGQVVIDDQGQWVGSPTGLVGPTGPQGARHAR